MIAHRTVSLIAVLMAVGTANGQQQHAAIPSDYSYAPAFISTISSPGYTELVVFPLRGNAWRLPVRSASGVVFGPNGESLYGPCTPYPATADEPLQVALCKIDLKAGRTIPIPGSTAMHGYYASSVSNQENHILFFGSSQLLDLSLPDGKIKTTLVQRSDNQTWMHLSLSPDGKRAVATHTGKAELIDIATGRTEPLGAGLFIAAWSPDGKWLAAVEQGEDGRTILLDAKTLKRVRILGPSELDWSPDSHYLLGLKSCDEFYGTLQTIDIETGERTTIESSKCQINQATIGWVSIDIAPK